MTKLKELGNLRMAVINYSHLIKAKPMCAYFYQQRAELFEMENVSYENSSIIKI
jgi:hypothetical protein